MAFDPPRFVFDDDDINVPQVNCEYYSPAILNNTIKNKFSILSLNIRSLRKNFTHLISFLNTFILNFSIIVLVETWLAENCDNTFSIPGYKECSVYRNNHGGGIKVLYQDSYSVDVLKDFSFIHNVLEILTFYIKGRGFKYLICCIYRPPNSSISDFNEMFFNQIFIKFPPNVDTILVGDFNINLLNPLNLRPVKESIGNMLSFNQFPVINIPAKININNPITKYSIIE